MRIVSLLPSATEWLFAMGVGDRVVGVTHECDHPPQVSRLPAVTTNLLTSGQGEGERQRAGGSTLSSAAIDAAVSAGIRDEHTIYALDVDALRALAPDVVVAQQLCDVCAVPVDAVEAAACTLGAQARVVAADPHTLDDLLPAAVELGRAVAAEESAAALAESLQHRLDAVTWAVADRPRPMVAMLEWPDPPWLPGHWAPDMIERAGGVSLFGRSGEPSRRATFEELAEVDADVVIAAFCGCDLAETIARTDEVSERPAWRSLIRGARLLAVDGSAYVSRPGPRLVDGVEALARALHGVGGPPPRAAVAEWRHGRWRDLVG
ncbi:MAG TPA: ABC transporter substrate-binding protein [Euzebyales bacterium]|nr:ABC transporter substrate-binding protein [Euzebyales bacterium]